MRTIKVGDKFRLGNLEWEVHIVREDDDVFWARLDAASMESLRLSKERVYSLDWLEPPITISKRAADFIKQKCDKNWPVYNTPDVTDMFSLLDSITEKE